jgi:hypothetical protein
VRLRVVPRWLHRRLVHGGVHLGGDDVTAPWTATFCMLALGLWLGVMLWLATQPGTASRVLDDVEGGE